jgi:hypothetical protein
VVRLMDGATLARVFAGPLVQQEEVFAPEFVHGAGI